MIRSRPAPRLRRSAISRLPGGRARQEEVGDIRAGDAEDEAHQRQEDVERLRIGPPQAVEAARAFPHDQRGDVLRPALRVARCGPIRRTGPASAACACDAVTPGRRRAMGTTQS